MEILIIVTNVAQYDTRSLPTGLWLSELTHLYQAIKEQGFGITIASPRGGDTPIDPESLKPVMLDRTSRNCWGDNSFIESLSNTVKLGEISEKQFACVYMTGGHGIMYDFPDDTVLQAIVKTHYENNKIVAAICHGVGGLLNVKLSNGKYLIEDKTITGFSWFEEILAGRRRKVPFNLEASLKMRGADYRKAFIPMTSNVIIDENLITGQNPFSSRKMSEIVIQQLMKDRIELPRWPPWL